MVQILLDALNASDTVLDFVDLSLPITIALQQIDRGIVPDMPDRVIAATALHLGLPLITRDAAIKASGLSTVW